MTNAGDADEGRTACESGPVGRIPPVGVACRGIDNFYEIPSAVIHPTMIPFITTLRVGENDKEKRLYFNIPDCNHNSLTVATVRDVMNNILNNVLGKPSDKLEAPTMGKDLSLLVLYSKAQVRPN